MYSIRSVFYAQIPCVLSSSSQRFSGNRGSSIQDLTFQEMRSERKRCCRTRYLRNRTCIISLVPCVMLQRVYFIKLFLVTSAYDIYTRFLFTIIIIPSCGVCTFNKFMERTAQVKESISELKENPTLFIHTQYQCPIPI